MHNFFRLIFLTPLFQVKYIYKKKKHIVLHTHTQIDEVTLFSFMFGAISIPPKLKLNNFLLYIL